MDNENQNNETFQNEHPAAPLNPVSTGLPQGASHTKTTTNESGKDTKAGKQPKIKQFEDDKTIQDKVLEQALNQEPAKYKISDFTSKPSIIKHSRHLTRVEDIFTKLGLKLRVPKIDRSFVPYAETFSYDGQDTNFATDYSFTPTINTPNPNGPNNFTDPAYNAPGTGYNRLTIHLNNQDLKVKWSSDVTQVLLTAISTNRWDWLKNGTRQNRAAAQATVTDVTALFTKDLDINLGTLDTNLVAQWMYSSYQIPAENQPTIYIININDLATFMNQSPISIISNKATLLDLSSHEDKNQPVNDNILSRLIVFKPDNNIIINIGAPVQNDDNYLGCPCKTIVCNMANVERLDQELAFILDQTLDEQTMEFAIWFNTYFMLANGAHFDAVENQISLDVFKADFQDQLVRYHSRPEPSLGVLTSTKIPRNQVFWTYRIAKTVLMIMAQKQFGIIPGFTTEATSGRAVDTQLFVNQYFSFFNLRTPYQGMNIPTGTYTPVWIPFEFINNNARDGWSLTLDGTTTTFGQRMAFNQYKWPKSIVKPGGDIFYININSNDDAPDNPYIGGYYSNAIPITVPYWRSNNRIQSINPSLFNHNKLFRVANNAWNETTYDNVIVEELTF